MRNAGALYKSLSGRYFAGNFTDRHLLALLFFLFTKCNPDTKNHRSFFFRNKKWKDSFLPQEKAIRQHVCVPLTWIWSDGVKLRHTTFFWDRRRTLKINNKTKKLGQTTENLLKLEAKHQLLEVSATLFYANWTFIQSAAWHRQISTQRPGRILTFSPHPQLVGLSSPSHWTTSHIWHQSFLSH